MSLCLITTLVGAPDLQRDYREMCIAAHKREASRFTQMVDDFDRKTFTYRVGILVDFRKRDLTYLDTGHSCLI